MAVFVIEDLHGKIDGVMFAEAFEKYGDVLKTDALVFLSGVIERSRERPSLRADEALPLNEAVERLTAALRLALPKPALAETVVGQVKDILGKYRGNTPVKIECQSQEEGNGRVVIEVDHQLRVKPSHSFICELVALLGKGMVHLEPKPLRANHETRYPRGPR
jgi:DNA polymerase-3 subunit alpha